MTRLIKEDWSNGEEEEIRSALETGRTIAFPTETVYGLGGNAYSEKLVEQIFEIKKRPRNKPLLLLVNSEELTKLTDTISIQAQQLMDQFWPAPLTLILKARPDTPQFLVGPNHTIAVRHSNSLIVQKLISMGKCPLIGTSANHSGTPEMSSAQDVYFQFEGTLDLLIDGGKTLGQKVSTIVDATGPLKIVRPGAISEEELQPFLKILNLTS